MAKPRPKAKSEESAPTPTAAAAPAGAAKPAAVSRPAVSAVYDDPALDAFTEGLQALQQKNWSKAAELLESALAQSDRADLSARARQFLASARQHLPATAGKTEKGSGKADGDPFLQAVFLKNQGDLAGALELCRKEGRDQKDERFAYLAASIQAAEGRIEEAVQGLTRAIELNPKNRVHAYHDPDFAELRRDRDRRPLFGLS